MCYQVKNMMFCVREWPSTALYEDDFYLSISMTYGFYIIIIFDFIVNNSYISLIWTNLYLP